MKRPVVVAVVRVVFPLIQVVWEPVVLESVVWKFEEANLLVTGGVPGKLASLLVAEVIASSADRSNLLTLAVSFSELPSLSEVSRFSSSDV
jgi:hypothetical protein